MRPLAPMCLLLLVGCASHDEGPVARSAILLDSLEEAPRGRPIIATVNDVPVYQDCVVRQAQAHGLSPKAALDECIDFELLAQAADQAGYAGDSSVQEAGMQELVRTYLDKSYPMKGPGDLDHALVDTLWQRINVPRYNHPPLRDVVLCRIPLDATMGPESAEYKRADAFLRTLYRELKDRDDLVENDLFAACYERYEEAGVHDLKLNTTRLAPQTQHDSAWSAEVFAPNTKAGKVLPPLRDAAGFAFILITEAKDELVTSFEEAEPELREALYANPVYQAQRDQLFQAWYKPIAARYKIQRFPERLPANEPVVSLGESETSP